MKSVSKKIIGYTLGILMVLSCESEVDFPKETIPNLGGNELASNEEIEKYYLENWTKPFNVIFKYRYDPFEVNYQVNSTPVREEFVIPASEMIRQVLVEPLIELKDSAFLRQFLPKLWVFLGSGEYQPDGTITLGTAEVGNKITIMDINKFNPSDREYVEWTMYVVFHELGHTFHQRTMYDIAFKYINPSLYTTTWFNYKESEAYEMGFVRNYGMASPDEDFVETLAYLLCRGQVAFDEIATSKSTPIGTERLRAKEELIVAYFKDRFDLDFREWQRLVRIRIQDLLDANQNPNNNPNL